MTDSDTEDTERYRTLSTQRISRRKEIKQMKKKTTKKRKTKKKHRLHIKSEFVSIYSMYVRMAYLARFTDEETFLFSSQFYSLVYSFTLKNDFGDLLEGRGEFNGGVIRTGITICRIVPQQSVAIISKRPKKKRKKRRKNLVQEMISTTKRKTEKRRRKGDMEEEKANSLNPHDIMKYETTFSQAINFQMVKFT